MCMMNLTLLVGTLLLANPVASLDDEYNGSCPTHKIVWWGDGQCLFEFELCGWPDPFFVPMPCSTPVEACICWDPVMSAAMPGTRREGKPIRVAQRPAFAGLRMNASMFDSVQPEPLRTAEGYEVIRDQPFRVGAKPFRVLTIRKLADGARTEIGFEMTGLPFSTVLAFPEAEIISRMGSDLQVHVDFGTGRRSVHLIAIGKSALGAPTKRKRKPLLPEPDHTIPSVVAAK